MYRVAIALAIFCLMVFSVVLIRQSPEPARATPAPLLLQVESMSRQLQLRPVPAKGGKAPTTRSWHLLLRRAKQEGWKGHLNGPISSVRTRSDQKYLYEAFLAGWGAPAFHPDGPSRHLARNIRWRGQWAQAVDVSRAEELIVVAREKLGVFLHQPYSDEPWHIEARSPFTLQKQGVAPTPPLREAEVPAWALLLLLPAFCLALLFRGRALLLLPGVVFAAALYLLQYPSGGAFLLLLLAFLVPWLFCANSKLALS